MGFFHRTWPGKINPPLLGMMLAMAAWLTGGELCAQGPKPSLRERLAPKKEAAEASDVQAYTVPAQQLEALTQELQKRYAGRDEVKIAGIQRKQQIVVIAPAAVQQEIAESLAAFSPASKPVEQRAQLPAAERVRGTHPLKNVSARDFELALARIWARRASFISSEDGRSTQVKIPFGPDGVVALGIDHERDLITLDLPKSAQDSWRQVIAAIDSPRRPGAARAELVALNKAEPSKVKRALELIKAVAEPQIRQTGPKTHIGQFVSMIFQPAEQVAAQPPAEGQPPPAERAPGDAPAAEEGDEDTGKIGPVQIEYIEGLDVFIIRGKKKDVERVQRIIAQIEAESEKTKPEVEVYMLEHVDDTAMAAMINQIYTPALGARQGTVTVIPLVKPNALLLVGRKEGIAAVIDLVKKLDQPVAPDRMLRIFSLKHVSAIDMETKLRTYFTTDPGRASTPRAGLGTRALIIADYRSNSLIVQASPRDIEEVSQIVDTLDVETPGVKNEIRVFRLKNSLADELIPVLQEAIYSQQMQQQIQAAGGGQGGQNILQQGQGQGGQGAGGTGGTPTRAQNTPKPTALTIQTIGKDGVNVLQSGILSDVRLSADPRANALVVTGPASSMDLMAALIEQLDGLPAVSAQVKVFRMIDADATQMATMLQTLFGQTQQGAQQGVQGFASATGQGENTLVPLKFSVDTRTNSIIASGNGGDLAVVNSILKGLDVKKLRERVTSVYRLKNSSADAVAAAINNYLQNRQTLNQNAPNLVSPVNLWEQAIIVVSEPVSQSLIVNTSPPFVEEIKRLVDQLDRRLNMVAVQVLIAEVQLSDVEQFGIELGLQDSLLFDRGIGTVGFPFNQANIGNNSTPASLATRNAAVTQGLSNLSLGRTDAALGYGGLVLSASSDSVNVLVRALQQSRRLQVLSRPTVQTVENQAASIQVGATVRFVGGTTISAGVAQNTVTTQDVGIILQITPRTNADGNIIMLVDAVKSELGPESEGTVVQGATTNAAGVTTAPVRVPQVKVTRASTTTNTRSGQTVILGGLITRNQDEVTRRVPYLADMPVLGRLFRYDSVQLDRKELLIIMTPYIIQTDEQQNWLNLRESERMSWCLADVANVHGEVPYISGTGPKNAITSPLIFPDENPTGPEEIPPPPVPGIAPPPMGPLPSILPSTSRRGGPGLEPITVAPQTQPATNVTAPPLRQPENSPPRLQAPPGAGTVGRMSPPQMPFGELFPAGGIPQRQGTTKQTQTQSPPARPWQNNTELPPPPALAPRDVAPAGYPLLEETGAEIPQRIEPAVYR